MPPELLNVQPPELKFPYFPAKAGRLRRVELKKQVSCSLRLTNPTDDYVAFKVKTTSPKKYSVRPNAGIVSPQSSIDVIITMQAQKEPPPDMQCRDKFLVQSVKAENSTSVKEVSQDLFMKENGREVYENKLKVVYVSPPQPPSPVPESAEEGLSPTKTANGDWIFSLSEGPKDSPELESKISEARAALTALSNERDLALHQNRQLQQEVNAQPAPSKGRRGFSLLFVFLVGFLGVLVGYFLRH